MPPSDIDSTAVAALSALLAVLTFVGGFVTVRLHGAYREAVTEQRNVTAALAEGEHTGSGFFPVARLEAHYQDMQRALNDLVAWPALVFVAVFTCAGVALAMVTGNQANLAWFDSDTPERFWGLALLAGGLVAVAALMFLDWWLLRRRLRKAFTASPVYRVLKVEKLLHEAATRKENAVRAQAKANEARFLVRFSEGLAREAGVSESVEVSPGFRSWWAFEG
jgi:hypothetical protein